MNDAQTSNRTQAILYLLIIKPHTRIEIEQALENIYPVSKITILRDLNNLIEMDFLISTGTGRSVKYTINNKKRLLLPINPDLYFAEGSKIRQFAKESFDENVFLSLYELFTKNEIKILEEKVKNLSKQKKVIDPVIFRKEIERITIEFSWKSSRIEGNTYSLLETEQLIRQKTEAKGHPKEEAVMILNHKETLSYVLDNPSEFNHLTVEKIIKIHAMMIKNLLVTPGVRSDQVGIAGTNYLPPANKITIEKYLEKTADAINKLGNPFTKALASISLISYLQPFTDGNKRTGRMIGNAILIASDLIPLSYRDVDELEYKKALIIFYEQNSLFSFKKIFIDQCIYSNTHYLQ